MTFLKLNRNDFTKTKITHKSHVKYDSSSSNYSHDFSLNSKNAVNTEFIIDIPVLEKAIEKYNEVENPDSAFSLTAAEKILYITILNEQISELKTRINRSLIVDENNFYTQNRFLNNLHDTILQNNPKINNKFYKYAISELFTTNEFKIKRVGQKFLPYSDELAKKNFIRDKLYRYYQDKIADEDHKNVSYTFTNYNTLNFCKIKNVNPGNAVVYPNPYNSDNSVHGYEFLDSNNFNISFWLNKRQTDNIDDAQCILHIPHFLSIYTVDTDSNKYSICIKGGDEANEYFIANTPELKSQVRSDTTSSIQNGANNWEFGVYGNNKLFANNWHNISINFLINDDSALILFYIDGQFIGQNIIDKTEAGPESDANNSIIMLGNKIKYNTGQNKPTFDTIYTQFFAKIKKSTITPAYGPYYNKDISLGKFDSYIDDDPATFDSIDSKWCKFDTNNSQHFEGEIHDIRIYKQNLSNEKILDVYKSMISNLNDEIVNFGLDFYVPVLYVPAEVSKKTSINLYGSETSNPDVNLPKQYYYKFNHIYNPVLANYCGGLELSIENFLIEFVKEVKPNIVIDSSNNLNDNNSGTNNFYNGSSDYLIFKNIKNITTVNFVKSNFQKGQILFEEFYKKTESINAKYYNSLILPNDNGLPSYSTNAIKYLIDNSSTSTLNINTKFYYLQKIYSKINLTETQNLLKKRPSTGAQPSVFNHDYFRIDKSIDYLNNTNLGSTEDSEPLEPENITVDGITYDSTADLIYDISNYYYHNGNFSDSTILSKKTKFNNLYFDADLRSIFTESNPVDRDFLAVRANINANDSEHVDTNEYHSYTKNNLPYYDINYEDCNFFNVYFDITNNLYGDKISPNSFVFTNKDSSYSDLILKDNGESGIYRANCLTKQAKWNVVGNLFYNEGILNINNPTICYIGLDNFVIDCKGENNIFVSEINLPLSSGKFDYSNNTTHDIDLRHDVNGVNSTESFVYITDIHLHDENYNIIANAKMAHPIPKKPSDKFTIRLKMDY